MFVLLLTNLQLFAGLLLIFLASFSANTLLGTFYNTTNLQEMFDRERFLTGVKRGGVVLAGLALLIVIVSLLPGILEIAGLTQIVPVASDLTVVSIAGIIASATIKYAKGAVQKLYKIVLGEDYKPITDEQLEVEPAETETVEDTKEDDTVKSDG